MVGRASKRCLIYAHPDYRRRLEELGFEASMSRKADCYDNAVTESFFGSLKIETDRRPVSENHIRRKVIDYIEVFYNRARLHSYLDYLPPAEFEARTPAAGSTGRAPGVLTT